ncbi:D-ribose pyranase [Agromyces intestinalis]|uniref:D-ribose pyranase n=1 Tax=Agromyces intestinalis TaxID=2592652 RepID=A0A5C1YKB9_9MICO|nr:D-ribose pyranase [Agromyces intestinalis]QEO15579.1 D-ribose pyranase [Agromyces intestinalis]
MITNSPILNPALLAALAGAGHGHGIVVADAGLPLPAGVPVIDLSLTPGTPSFAVVVRAVLESTPIESYVVAAESATDGSFDDWHGLDALLAHMPVTWVSHEEFTARLPSAHIVIRTGECTPYANIALIAGTTFS